MSALKKTYTITYGDVAENHAGMQKIGDLHESGYSVQKIAEVQAKLNDLGLVTELVDLTGEDLNQVQVQVQVQVQEEQEPPVHRTTRVLPEQDQAMLLRTEEEFGEVLRRHTSLDRLEKHRGDCKKNAITISDDMRCDCIEKCKDGYECYASKHVMCRKMLTQDRKCYLCGSRVL